MDNYRLLAFLDDHLKSSLHRLCHEMTMLSCRMPQNVKFAVSFCFFLSFLTENITFWFALDNVLMPFQTSSFETWGLDLTLERGVGLLGPSSTRASSVIFVNVATSLTSICSQTMGLCQLTRLIIFQKSAKKTVENSLEKLFADHFERLQRLFSR